MAYGLKVRGSHGAIQIDEAYANFTLVAKGTITTTTTSGPFTDPINNQDTYTLSAATINTGLTQGPYCIAYYSTSFVTQTGIGFNTDGQFFANVAARGNAGQVIEWFVFGRPSECPAPPPGWGIQIRNPATNLIRYDSRLKYMVIVGELFHSARPSVTESQGPFISGKCAVMHSRPVFQWYQRPQVNFSPGSVALMSAAWTTPIGSPHFGRTTIFAQNPSGGTTPNNQPVSSDYPDTGFYYVVDVSSL